MDLLFLRLTARHHPSEHLSGSYRNLIITTSDHHVLCLQAKEKEAEQARALQAAEARSKQAMAELKLLKQKHSAQVAALEASHAEALQQQKSTMEKQHAVCVSL